MSDVFDTAVPDVRPHTTGLSSSAANPGALFARHTHERVFVRKSSHFEWVRGLIHHWLSSVCMCLFHCVRRLPPHFSRRNARNARAIWCSTRIRARCAAVRLAAGSYLKHSLPVLNNRRADVELRAAPAAASGQLEHRLQLVRNWFDGARSSAFAL